MSTVENELAISALKQLKVRLNERIVIGDVDKASEIAKAIGSFDPRLLERAFTPVSEDIRINGRNAIERLVRLATESGSLLLRIRCINDIATQCQIDESDAKRLLKPIVSHVLATISGSDESDLMLLQLLKPYF